MRAPATKADDLREMLRAAIRLFGPHSAEAREVKMALDKAIREETS